PPAPARPDLPPLSLHDALPISLDHGIDGPPGPCPDAPFGAAVVLRLNRPEPAHDVSRVGEGGGEEMLSGESPLGDVVTRASHGADRKSTRLNSSHGSISYAVFC